MSARFVGVNSTFEEQRLAINDLAIDLFALQNETAVDYARVAGVATYAEYAGFSTFTPLAGVSTYSSISGYSTTSGYAGAAGIATNATFSVQAGYAITLEYQQKRVTLQQQDLLIRQPMQRMHIILRSLDLLQQHRILKQQTLQHL